MITNRQRGDYEAPTEWTEMASPARSSDYPLLQNRSGHSYSRLLEEDSTSRHRSGDRIGAFNKRDDGPKFIWLVMTAVIVAAFCLFIIALLGIFARTEEEEQLMHHSKVPEHWSSPDMVQTEPVVEGHGHHDYHLPANHNEERDVDHHDPSEEHRSKSGEFRNRHAANQPDPANQLKTVGDREPPAIDFQNNQIIALPNSHISNMRSGGRHFLLPLEIKENTTDQGVNGSMSSANDSLIEPVVNDSQLTQQNLTDHSEPITNLTDQQTQGEIHNSEEERIKMEKTRLLRLEEEEFIREQEIMREEENLKREEEKLAVEQGQNEGNKSTEAIRSQEKVKYSKQDTHLGENLVNGSKKGSKPRLEKDTL